MLPLSFSSSITSKNRPRISPGSLGRFKLQTQLPLERREEIRWSVWIARRSRLPVCSCSAGHLSCQSRVRGVVQGEVPPLIAQAGLIHDWPVPSKRRDRPVIYNARYTAEERCGG